MNDAQTEESYARRAAFTAGERSAVREKVFRRAFKLGVLATFCVFLLWTIIPNAYSIWTMLLAIPVTAGLGYSLVWLISRRSVNEELRRRIALLRRAEELKSQQTINRTT